MQRGEYFETAIKIKAGAAFSEKFVKYISLKSMPFDGYIARGISLP